MSITNKDNSLEAIFRGVFGWKTGKTQPVIPIPIVNSTPQNNVLFRFFGQTQSLSFNFSLFDDDSDISNGTHGSTVKTIEEQHAYLQNDFYTEDFDVDWTLIQEVYHPSPGIDGVITDLKVNNEAGSPALAIGTLSFTRGRIGSL